MELKRKSFSAKLYKWFYGVRSLDTLHDGCSYQLRLIVAYLMCIPCGIFGLPAIIFELFDKHYEIGDSSVGDRFGYSLFLGVLILAVVSLGTLISTYWVDYEINSAGSTLTTFGIMFSALIIFIFGMFGYDKIKEYVRHEMGDRYDYDEQGNKIKRVPKNKILAFIKAKKEKSCEKITWID